jgi:hypothetical protein
MKHCDCSPFARPASFAQLAMAAYTPLLAIETIPSPFCSGADILPLTMGRFAPKAALGRLEIQLPLYPRKQTQLGNRGMDAPHLESAED